MKIIVIDNDEVFLKYFLTLIEPLCKKLYENFALVGYNTFHQDINDSDIIFLDVDLDNFDGIDIARQVRRVNKKAKIIFVTLNNHLVYNALTVQPFYFIRKNQLDLDLSTAFSLLKDTVEERKIYSFHYNGIENSVYVDEITYIDISDHLSSIHMLNKQEYHFYKPLSQIVKEVDNHLLCQIHKKYYVNLKYIKLIKGNVVKLLNEEEFVIGRKYKDSMLKAYREYGKEV